MKIAMWSARPVRTWSVLLIGATAFLSEGCHREPSYIGLYNATDVPLYGAHVVYGDFVSAGGILIPGSEVSDGPAPQPFPPKALVIWNRTKGGEAQWRRVPFGSVVPAGFYGDVYFRFERDGSITVVPIQRLATQDAIFNDRRGPTTWKVEDEARRRAASTRPSAPRTEGPATTPHK